MSSLSSKDRVSLCSFTFSDGRRCRTPRFRNNPRFCPYHAQKEARARAAQKLGKGLSYFFSGDYLSACDLSTALARLIPAVVRGDVKPKTARTVAYMAQTLLQAIHISQHEYSYAFGDDGWRQSIRNSIKGNHDYLFPPAPKVEQPAAAPSNAPQPAPSAFWETLRNEQAPSPQPHSAQTPVNWHSDAVVQAFRPEEPAFSSSPAKPPTHAPQSEIPLAPAMSGTLSGPVPSPHTPLPTRSAEFAQHAMPGLARSVRSGSTGETAGRHTPQPTPAPQSEILGLSGPPPAPQPATAPPSTPTQPAVVQSNPPQPAPVAQPIASLALPLPVRRRLHRAPYAVHFDHNCRLFIEGKPV